MKVDGTQLIALLRHSLTIGTEAGAIDLAEEWVVSAENEIGRLRERITEMSEQGPADTDNEE